MTFIPLLIIFIALLGGIISRWHGGGFFPAPKLLKNFVWAVPFAIVSYIATSQWWAALIVLAWTMVFKATGHGGAMDLGHSTVPRDPEKLEYLVLWLRDRIPTYWYDFLTLTIIGIFSVMGASFAVGYVNVLAGSIIAIGASGKPLGYAFGWSINENIANIFDENVDEPTEIGEFLTGFVAYLCLSVAAVVIL